MNPIVTLWNRFWFEFKVPASKLNALRIIFFSVLAVDLFFQLEHAPRYGAGDFNVSHILALDGILGVPSRVAIVVTYLLQCYLAARIVLGVSITWSVRLLAVLYGWTYLISQLDAYQHHYLIMLLLVIASFIPWERARCEASEARQLGSDRDTAIASWALRLFVVQLALLYFWAAFTKMSGSWLDGTALQSQMSVAWVRDAIDATVGYGGMAWLIMLGELALAVGIFWRKLWPLVWLVGVGFHVSVELAGFKIGLFSYFMVGLYVLFLPDALLTAIARAWRAGTAGFARWLKSHDTMGGRIAGVLAIALGVGGLLLVPLEAAGTTAIAVSIAGAITVLLRVTPSARIAAGHLAACAVLLVMHLSSEQAFNYYKFLGGTSRRLGDDNTMRMAYEELLELRPGYGPAHYHLGNLAVKDGDAADDSTEGRKAFYEQAFARFRAAQLREPKDTRPFVAAADLYRKTGDLPAAHDILQICLREVPDASGCSAHVRRLDAPESP